MAAVVPLAVLELYLRVKKSAGPQARFAMACGLAVLTLLMSIGLFGRTMLVCRYLGRV